MLHCWIKFSVVAQTLQIVARIISSMFMVIKKYIYMIEIGIKLCRLYLLYFVMAAFHNIYADMWAELKILSF
jgi:hypothetical protein